MTYSYDYSSSYTIDQRYGFFGLFLQPTYVFYSTEKADVGTYFKVEADIGTYPNPFVGGAAGLSVQW